MRALLQRVIKAKVSINGAMCDEIGQGYVIFLGIGEQDDNHTAERLWNKIRNERIFEDETGKTNLSLLDVNGQCMVISQFTLYADCKKGRRPSFDAAMPAAGANELYEFFLELVESDRGSVAHGEFGAMMDIELVNNGPFTIWLDTEQF